MAHYKVYVDGAANDVTGVIACAYIVLTNKKFISLGYQYAEGNSSRQAEINALGAASAAILDTCGELSSEDKVTFYTDCVSAIGYVNDVVSNRAHEVSENNRLFATVQTVRELMSKCKVELSKIHGHRGDLNPNVVVDGLCKYALREYKCSQ